MMRRSSSEPSQDPRGSVRLSARSAARLRLAIIRADYNRDITLSLEVSCVRALREGGIAAKNIDLYSVPGCFEIPLFSRRLAELHRYDALIALGAVIRGETHHFELVANECARGIMDVSLVHNIPIIFEVLATYNRRDALRRAGNNNFNKGVEAARSALSLLKTLSRLKG
jgi:6,7-dimethyl-8-ribityllumazine synthase